MKKYHYKIIIAFLLTTISWILFPNPFSIITSFFSGVFAHSVDRDKQLSIKENKNNE